MRTNGDNDATFRPTFGAGILDVNVRADGQCRQRARRALSVWRSSIRSAGSVKSGGRLLPGGCKAAPVGYDKRRQRATKQLLSRTES